MDLIQWNDTLSVGVSEIDKQHKELVRMINQLNDAMKVGKAKDQLGEILVGLVKYALSHFKTEEIYFDKFGFPEAISHKKEHLDFTQKVSDFKKSFDAGTVGLSVSIMTFLSNWLTNHIKTTDKKYSKLFNDKGLK